MDNESVYFEALFIPKLVLDTRINLLYETDNSKQFILGSLEKDKFLEFPEELHVVLTLLIQLIDGNRNVSEINQIMMDVHGFEVSVEEFLDLLAKSDLLINNPVPQKVEKDGIEKHFIKVFSMKIDNLHRFFYSQENIIIKKFSLLITALINLIALVMAGYVFCDQSLSIEMNSSYVMGAGLGILVYVVSISLHEIGHAIAAMHYGLRPRELTMGLYLYVTPMVYLHIPGLYTVKKRDKIVIWGAGVYANMCLGSLCFLVWVGFSAFQLSYDLLILAATINFGLVLMNLYPLLPLDGYFILTTLFNRPNLRKKSFAEFKKWVTFKSHNFKGLNVWYVLLTSVFFFLLVLLQLYYVKDYIVMNYQKYGSVLNMYRHALLLQLVTIVIIVKLVIHIFKCFRSKSKMIRRNVI